MNGPRLISKAGLFQVGRENLIVIFLSSLLGILLVYGFYEYYQHYQVLINIPARIHVNGSRGKSSVTRLIAAGLRAGGIRTLAKTTGSAPRVIEMDGNDRVIHRLRSASIGEQVKLLRAFAQKKPDAVVIECMAVMPQYQWVAEHRMVQSTIGVLTNVRPDHIEEMGPLMDDIAHSLANTVPKNGLMITSETHNLEPIRARAKKLGTIIKVATPEKDVYETLKKIPFLEHDDNIALAVKVCEEMGVDRKTALDGMVHAKPDPGALVLWNLKFGDSISQFLSAFAANDPLSTLKIWRLIQERIDSESITVFLNSRHDRRHRTKQLMKLVYEHIHPHAFIVRGDNLPPELNILKKKYPKTMLFTFPLSASPEEVIEHLKTIHDNFIFGIGNIVGWGDEFVAQLKGYRVNG